MRWPNSQIIPYRDVLGQVIKEQKRKGKLMYEFKGMAK